MFTTRPTLQGTFGMVSSTHWLASQSAMAVLEDGGNAYDAAVAAGFVLHVVEPHLNGPAGDLPVILAPAGGDVRVLCGQGPAPGGATIEHYRSLGLELVPGTGPLAAAVPGAFDAWMLLLRDHGTKSLAQVLRYAIGYAEDGHAPVERVGQTVESVRALFETEWTSSADVYLPGGRAPAPGELFRNPALAATWRRLTAEAEATGGDDRVAQIEAARDIWRTGFIAEALIRQSDRPTLDTSGSRHTGTLTAADLAAGPRRTRRPRRTSGTAGPSARPPAGARAPSCSSSSPCCRPCRSFRRTAPRSTSTSLRRAASSPWPTGRPGTATPPPYRSPRFSRSRTTPRAARWLGRRPPTNCGPAAPTAARPSSARTRPPSPPVSRASTRSPSRHRGRASRPSPATGRPAATPATSMSWTGGATWSPPRRAAAGSSPTPSCPNSASRSAPASRWPGWSPDCPTPHAGPQAPYDPHPVHRPARRRARPGIRYPRR